MKFLKKLFTKKQYTSPMDKTYTYDIVSLLLNSQYSDSIAITGSYVKLLYHKDDERYKRFYYRNMGKFNDLDVLITGNNETIDGVISLFKERFNKITFRSHTHYSNYTASVISILCSTKEFKVDLILDSAHMKPYNKFSNLILHSKHYKYNVSTIKEYNRDKLRAFKEYNRGDLQAFFSIVDKPNYNDSCELLAKRLIEKTRYPVLSDKQSEFYDDIDIEYVHDNHKNFFGSSPIRYLLDDSISSSFYDSDTKNILEKEFKKMLLSNKAKYKIQNNAYGEMMLLYDTYNNKRYIVHNYSSPLFKIISWDS